MNILFSCDEYPPARTGGIGTVTKIVAEGLAARGHNVYVVSCCMPGHGLPACTVNRGVTIYRLTCFRGFGPIVNNARISTALNRFGLLATRAGRELRRLHGFMEKLIATHSIDIVEMPDYIMFTPYYSSKKRVKFIPFSVPTVARVHGSKSFLSYYKTGHIPKLSRANDIDFFSAVSGISAVSGFSARFLSEHLGVEAPVEVIYNPLDMHQVDAAMRRAEPYRGGHPFILFFGKIVETKGAFSILKAFNEFSRSYPDYELLLAGGGEIDYARTLVEPHAAPRVHFLGYVQRDNLLGYIRDAQFCVIPSYYENFSMAALEVMSLGKTLVYTRETSGPEVIDDGVDGILVDPRAPGQIVEKMKQLAADPSLCSRMGAAAQEKVQNNFSLDHILRNLETFYSKYIHN